MKLVVAFLLTLVALLVTLDVRADQSVRGYVRHNGTYVDPYVKTTPDTSLYNNYNPPSQYQINKPIKNPYEVITPQPYKNPYGN